MTYFTRDELKCKCGCGLVRFHPEFMDELEALRVAFGQPMIVNSCCRCASHNKSVGGHPRSLHVADAPQHEGQQGTLAIDIRASGQYRGDLFELAWARGWSVGWGRGFLHLDRRDYLGLPQQTFDY